jgi:hypothetical protein
MLIAILMTAGGLVMVIFNSKFNYTNPARKI